jgi:ATP-dependent Clp protease adaptor protein ClpS
MEQTATIVRPSTTTRPRVEQPRLWNVVLLDDDDHTYEYVIEMMIRVFAYPLEKGVQIAKTVDTQGRAICFTTHREHAELKIEQIHACGGDPRMTVSAGSMSAILEPADFDSDDSGNNRR